VCGVVAAIGTLDIGPAVDALTHRGPDATGTARRGPISLGHTRLAILDLDRRSNQPFTYGQTTVSYNGECWNYAELRAELERAGDVFATTGDTEVIAAALDRWGPAALDRIQGMFALAWTAGDSGGAYRLHLARDRFGEVPLHLVRAPAALLAVSELKALVPLGLVRAPRAEIGPGEHWTLTPRLHTGKRRWYTPPATPVPTTRAAAASQLAEHITTAVRERAIADVSVCTLLSGGIDSASVTAALVAALPTPPVAYTAVLDPASTDLRAARTVAEHLGISLVEVKVPVPTAGDLGEVIRIIEQRSKAQIEIGWACLHLARQIASDGHKVTFTGEGSDELWASYGFAYHVLGRGPRARTQPGASAEASRDTRWHTYRRELFLAQAHRNFPRANKAFMAYGVECRLPFLHTPLVEFALGLERQVVQEHGWNHPKAIMAAAGRHAGLLPEQITGRAKLAFQEGMGLKGAIAEVLADPARFYRAEFRRLYG
jgi:asparagine synthase (glutamine-hydrolysing)